MGRLSSTRRPLWAFFQPEHGAPIPVRHLHVHHYLRVPTHHVAGVGNALSDVGSGNCLVHNTSLYDYPEKTVLYAPWRLYPVAFWTDITNKDAVVDAFIQFCVQPGVISLLRTVIAALQAA